MKSKTDHTAKVLEYFQRFFKDIIGVLLISTALVSLLGFFHLSQGKLLNNFVKLDTSYDLAVELLKTDCTVHLLSTHKISYYTPSNTGLFPKFPFHSV